MSTKNKKEAKKVIYDDKEDLEIKRVAKGEKNTSQYILLVILIILFSLTFFCSLYYVTKYYGNTLNINGELIEINNSKNRVLIANNGEIEGTILKEDLNNQKDKVIEKVNEIVINTNKDSETIGKIYFDVKYDISKNEFNKNVVSTTNGDVLVRFAYSYDNENWTYINNVISTEDSNLSPLMMNYYDISGLVTTLSVSTNQSLSSNIGKTKRMFWKSETLIKNNENNLNKMLNAEFKIVYKTND